MSRVRGPGGALAMALAAIAAAGALAVAVVPDGQPPAGASTDPTGLVGQGGSFLQPVVTKLLNDDSTRLAPVLGAYQMTGIDAGVGSFVGTAPGDFGADFAVSERPLTAAEAAKAAADHRTYAYVPFAATPVSIFTLVPTNTWAVTGSTSIGAIDFCRHIPLTTAQLGDVFGQDAAQPLKSWGDVRITCPSSTTTPADNVPITRWANLDPSMANLALMTLLDSTPGSKAAFDAGLAGPGSLTTSDAPSEEWPYAAGTIVGGDQPLIGKLLAINAETNLPSTVAVSWQLGAVGPISSVWTGSPLGVPWNLPTAAIQNTQGSFVAPSLAAATAASGHAAVASTSDPATSNVVTFEPSATDSVAYNNDLMVESYLVVPTSGLPPAKALALSQLVRFVLGPQGQRDISAFGAAPATAAMQAVGLKVAAALDAEAVASAAVTTTTTTTTATTTAPASPTGPGAASPAGSGAGSAGSDPGAGTGGSGPTLAFTGAGDAVPIVMLGSGLAVAGALARRRLRHREVHP